MNSRHSSQKKVCGLSVSPFKTDHWGVTETDCSHSQCTCHAKTHVCLSGNVRHWCSIWSFISNSPVSERALIPVSPCKHEGDEQWAKSCSHADMQESREKRDGKRGKGRSGKQRRAAREEEEYKTGWWTQTETVRESEGHLPPPSGCWVHSLCEGYLSQSGHLRKVGFSRVRKKRKKRKMHLSQKIKA